MEEKKDLWELVRKKLEKNSIPESLEFVENESVQTTEKEKIKDESTDNENLSITNEINFEETITEPKKVEFLNQGIFAGFIYILTIMIVLGILMIPGSITAAIGGYFGGKKIWRSCKSFNCCNASISNYSLYFSNGFNWSSSSGIGT